jgi:hypothetical protein
MLITVRTEHPPIPADFQLDVEGDVRPNNVGLFMTVKYS